MNATSQVMPDNDICMEQFHILSDDIMAFASWHTKERQAQVLPAIESIASQDHWLATIELMPCAWSCIMY